MTFFVVVQAVSKLICMPKGTQQGQIIDAVVSYLTENPDAREYVAAADVLNALKEAFPRRQAPDQRPRRVTTKYDVLQPHFPAPRGDLQPGIQRRVGRSWRGLIEGRWRGALTQLLRN